MTGPTFLDHAIGWLSPRWGRKRLMERAWTSVVQSFYDGATRGRRGSSIRRSLADPQAITARDLSNIRTGSRDLHRNNAHVRRGTEAIVSNTVGTGIRPKFILNGETADELTALAKRHLETTDCDSDGRLTYFGIQHVAFWAAVEAGEVLIRRRRRRMADGFAVPVQYQILEAEYLDQSKDGPTAGGGEIIQGVEFDAIGRRRQYWLYRKHPGGTRAMGQSRPVPADDIIHLYRLDRPGQVRGVPWVAPIMLRMADYGDAVDAQVMRYKIAACYAAFITSPFDSPRGVVEEDEDGQKLSKLAPGIIDRLAPGEEVEFGRPPPVEGYDEFANVTLREIAAGRGISYEMMTGDLRGVNFSSGKMGRVEAQRNIDVWQQMLLIPEMCDPMMAWFLEGAELVGMDVRAVEVRHKPPGREMIDPPREGRAEREMIRSGQKNLFQVLRERGVDPTEHLEEYAEVLALLDKLGIVVDSDARQRTNAGLRIGDGQADDAGGDGGDDGGGDVSDVVNRLEDLEDFVATRSGQ